MLQWSINIWSATWETGGRGESWGGRGRWRNAVWIPKRCEGPPGMAVASCAILFSLALPAPNPWDTPKSPFQSSQSLQKCFTSIVCSSTGCNASLGCRETCRWYLQSLQGTKVHLAMSGFGRALSLPPLHPPTWEMCRPTPKAHSA